MRYSRKKILAFIAHSCRLNRGFSAPPLDTPDGKCNNFIKGPDPYDGEDYVQYLQKSPSWQRTEILHLCQAGQWIHGYQLIHMTRTDQEGHGTILGEQSLFFRDGNPIKIGRRIKFDDVRDFYRYSK